MSNDITLTLYFLLHISTTNKKKKQKKNEGKYGDRANLTFL